MSFFLLRNFGNGLDVGTGASLTPGFTLGDPFGLDVSDDPLRLCFFIILRRCYSRNF
ncbi:hypothetical protein M407DRAFT_174693 [Tulasnella calospora MUT 4182]|uniref:Uncharacterized protein n=1 Tax=Tulasnella calospora MUT 4182 TaxID=1051891 RepID=A0A0C3M5R1_9AGAM|nr:hypothetical protein M407DRAFT_174693 [Tulasnella calospora MUT 4182]